MVVGPRASGRRGRVRAALLSAVAAVLVGAGLLWGSPAGAVVLSCAPGPEAAPSQTVYDPWSVRAALTFTPAGGVPRAIGYMGTGWNGPEYGVDNRFDVDGDGAADGLVRVTARSFARFTLAGGLKYEPTAVYEARQRNQEFLRVIEDEFGVSYGWRNGLSRILETLGVLYAEVSLIAEDATGGPTTLPAGRFSFDVSIRALQNAAGWRWNTLHYGLWVDGGPSAFPARSDLAVFADVMNSVAAVGVQTQDASGAQVPVGGLHAGGRLPGMREVGVGFDEAPAGSAKVGFPGNVGVAVRGGCAKAAGIGVEVAYGHDRAVTGGRVPYRLAARADLTDEEDRRTMYVDAGLEDVASRWGVRFSQHDADVTGDGVGDARDVNGDGWVEFPDDRVTWRHNGDAPMHLGGVAAMLSPEAPAEDPLYAAFDLALPPRLEADLVGGYGGADANGDGVVDTDELTRDVSRVDLRACEGAWGSPSCLGTTGTVGGGRYRVANSLPAEAPDGSLPRVLREARPVPAVLGGAEPPQRVGADVDLQAGRWEAGATLTGGVTHTGLDFSDGTHGVLDWDAGEGAGGGFGLDGSFRAADGSMAATLNGVFDEMPAAAEVRVDMADELGAGFELSNSPTLRLAADLHGAAGTDLYATATVTVPRRATVTAGFETLTEGRLAWEADAPAFVDLGASARTPGADPLYARVDASVPRRAHLAWGLGAGDVDVSYDTCDTTGEDCAGGDVEAVVGQDPALVAGYDTARPAIPAYAPAVPAEVAAGAAGHFTPEAGRYAALFGAPGAGPWHALLNVAAPEALSVRADYLTGEAAFDMRTGAAVPFAVHAEGVFAGVETDTTAVLAALPARLAATFRPGNPLRVGFESSQRTGVALAARAGVPYGAEVMPAYVSGWVGTGAGVLDGLPDVATATLETAGDTTRVRLEASNPVAVDVGAAADVPGVAEGAWVHTLATVPALLDVTLDGATGGARASTCRAPGDCSPADARLAAGLDPARTAGYWPLGVAPGVFEAPTDPDLVASSLAHFTLAAEDFAALRHDAAGLRVDAALSGLREAGFTQDATGGLHADVGLEGGDPFGLDLRYDDTDVDARLRGVLASLPETFSAAYDPGAQSARVSASRRSGMLLATDVTLGGAVSLDTRSAVWVGSGDGAADGTPDVLDVGFGGGRYTWDTPAPTRVDAALTARYGATPASTFFGRLQVTVPSHLEASFDPDTGALGVSTCEDGACEPVGLSAVAGEDPLRPVGYWAALEALPDMFPAVPFALAATSGAHFDPAQPEDFVAVAGSLPAHDWQAGIKIATFQEAHLAQNPATGAYDADMRVAEGRRFGVAADLDLPGMHADAWTVVRDVPETVGVSFDGAPLAVRYRGARPFDTALHAAVSMGTTVFGATGWADDVPASAAFTMGSGGGVTSLRYSASGRVGYDVGGYYRAGADKPVWARVKGEVPSLIDVRLALSDAAAQAATVTTCDGGVCSPADVEVVAGRGGDAPGDAGAALQAAFQRPGAVPSHVTGSTAGHFVPDPAGAQYATATGDVDTLEVTAGARVTGLTSVGFASATVGGTSGIAAAVGEAGRTPGAGQFVVDADVTVAGQALAAWSALEKLPSLLAVGYAATATGDTMAARYQASENTQAAFAVPWTLPDGTPLDAAGWIGSADMIGGGEDGVPEDLTVTLAGAPAGLQAELDASSRVLLDLGVALRTAAPTKANPGLWAHVEADVPSHIEVGMADGLYAFSACPDGGTSCGTAAGFGVRARGGLRTDATQADLPAVPLAQPFGSFPDYGAVPDGIAATQGDHFPATAEDFVAVDGNLDTLELAFEAAVAGVTAGSFGVMTDTGGNATTTATLAGGDGDRPLGLAVGIESKPVGGLTWRADAWGVLSAVPAELEAALGADPAEPSSLDVDLATLGDDGLPEAVGAALYVEGYESTLLGPSAALGGWVGTGDGAVDGVGGLAHVQFWPSAAKDAGALAAFGTTQATALDFGFGAHQGPAALDQRLAWGRVRATTPDFLDVSLFNSEDVGAPPDGAVHGGRLTTCRESGDCSPGEVAFVLAYEAPGDAPHPSPGDWPLTEDVEAPEAPEGPAPLGTILARGDTGATGLPTDPAAALRVDAVLPAAESVWVETAAGADADEVNAHFALGHGDGVERPVQYQALSTGPGWGTDSGMVIGGLNGDTDISYVGPNGTVAGRVGDFSWDLAAAATVTLDAEVRTYADFPVPAYAGARARVAGEVRVPETGRLQAYRAPLGTSAGRGKAFVAGWDASGPTTADLRFALGGIAVAPYLAGDQAVFTQVRGEVPTHLAAMARVRVEPRFSPEPAHVDILEDAWVTTCTPVLPVNTWLTLGFAADLNDCGVADVEGVAGVAAQEEDADGDMGIPPRVMAPLSAPPGDAPVGLRDSQAGHTTIPEDPAGYLTAQVEQTQTPARALLGAGEEAASVLAGFRFSGLALAYLNTPAGAAGTTVDAHIQLAQGADAFVTEAGRRVYAEPAAPGDPVDTDALLVADRAYGAMSLPQEADLTLEYEPATGADPAAARLGWNLGTTSPVVGFAAERDPHHDTLEDLGFPSTAYPVWADFESWVGDSAVGLPARGEIQAAWSPKAVDVAYLPDAAGGSGADVPVELAATLAERTLMADEGLVGTGKLTFALPDSARLMLNFDDEARFQRVDLSGCRDEQSGCGPEEGLHDVRGAFGVVRDPGYGGTSFATYGPLPEAPATDRTPAMESGDVGFDDEDSDFVRLVSRSDAEGSGLALKLTAVDYASFGTARKEVTAPRSTLKVDAVSACAQARVTATTRFQVYDDALVARAVPGGLLYLDTALRRADDADFPTAGPVRLALQHNMVALDGDGDGAPERSFGDLDWDERAVLNATTDPSPLVWADFSGCDPAALFDETQAPVSVGDLSVPRPSPGYRLTLGGIVRFGTPAGIDAAVAGARNRELAELFHVPTHSQDPFQALALGPDDPGGVALSALGETYGTGEAGLQALLNWRVPSFGVVHQPVVARCGEGTQATVGLGTYDVCAEEHEVYDRTDGYHAEVTAAAGAVVTGGGLGKMGATVVLDAKDGRGDGKLNALEAYVERIPSRLEVAADVEFRHRDNHVGGLLHVAQDPEGELPVAALRYWDANAPQPARIKPPPAASTGGADTAAFMTNPRNDEAVPNLWLMLKRVPESIDVALDLTLGGLPVVPAGGGAAPAPPGTRAWQMARCFGDTPANVPFVVPAMSAPDSVLSIRSLDKAGEGPSVTQVAPGGASVASAATTVDGWDTSVAPRKDAELRGWYAHAEVDLGNVVRSLAVAAGLSPKRAHSSAAGAPAERTWFWDEYLPTVGATVAAFDEAGEPAALHGKLRVLVPSPAPLEQHLAFTWRQLAEKIGLPPEDGAVGNELVRLDLCWDIDVPLSADLAGVQSLDARVDLPAMRLRQSGAGSLDVDLAERYYGARAYGAAELPDVATPGAYHHAAFARVVLPSGVQGPSLLAALTNPGAAAASSYKAATGDLTFATFFLRRINTWAPVATSIGGLPAVSEVPMETVAGTLAELAKLFLYLPDVPVAAALPTLGDAGLGPDALPPLVHTSAAEPEADMLLAPMPSALMPFSGAGAPAAGSALHDALRVLVGVMLAPRSPHALPGPVPGGLDAGVAAQDGPGELETVWAAERDNDIGVAANSAGHPNGFTGYVGSERLLGVLSDGTEVRLRAVFNRNGNLQLWVLGDYPHLPGEPPVGRFARLVAQGVGCFGEKAPMAGMFRIQYSFTVTGGTFRFSADHVDFKIVGDDGATTAYTPVKNLKTVPYSELLDATTSTVNLGFDPARPPAVLIGDASGNLGWARGDDPAGSVAVVTGGNVPHEAVFHLTEQETTSGVASANGCYLHPGDGTRVTLSGREGVFTPDGWSLDLPLAYARSGTYRPHVTCAPALVPAAGWAWTLGAATTEGVEAQ